MALSTFVDLVNVNTATTGTGTMTLGSAVSGWVGVGALVNGLTYSYKITDGTNYEAGQGVYTTSGTTMTRAAITESSNGGAAITLSGTATVIITELSADFPDMGRFFLAGKLIGANFNVTTDQAITLAGPSNAAGTSLWAIALILVRNPSISMTTAKGGFYAGTGKTLPIYPSGSGLITTTPWTALHNSTSAVSYAAAAGLFPAGAQASGVADNLVFATASATIQFSLTTIQGAAATADIRVFALNLN